MAKNQGYTKEPKARFHGRIIRFGGYSFLVLVLFFPILFMNAQLPESLSLSWQNILASLREQSFYTLFFWIFATFLPLLVLTGAYGAYEALKDRHLLLMKFALIAAYFSAFSFLVGMSQWSGIAWELSSIYQNGGMVDDTKSVDLLMTYIDLYIGQYIGQNIAEVSLFIFIFLSSLASFRHARIPNWQAVIGVVTAVFGLVGAFRHYNETADAFFKVSQSLALTPVWMLTFGLALLFYKRRQG